MIKLKSGKYTKGEYSNQKLNFPVIGYGTFDKEGNLEVEDDDVEEFILLTKESFDFSVVAEDGGKEKTEEELKKEEDNKKLKDDLDKMDIKALSELINDAGIDRKKAATWTDQKLRKELYKKLAA